MDDAPFRLARPLEAFVADQVRSGAYPDRQALFADAIGRLKEQIESDDLKMIRLRKTIADAAERLNRGEGEVVEDLDGYFEQIFKEATRR